MANSDLIARLTIQTFHILRRISCQKDAFWHNHKTIFIVLVVFQLPQNYIYMRKEKRLKTFLIISKEDENEWSLKTFKRWAEGGYS